jgi:hypothetical protein
MPALISDLARVTAEDFRRAHPDVSSALANDLAVAVELALLTAVRGERRECAAECTRRAELWRRTADKPDVTEPLRIEAEHREKEALYLADAIAVRQGRP